MGRRSDWLSPSLDGAQNGLSVGMGPQIRNHAIIGDLVRTPSRRSERRPSRRRRIFGATFCCGAALWCTPSYAIRNVNMRMG